MGIVKTLKREKTTIYGGAGAGLMAASQLDFLHPVLRIGLAICGGAFGSKAAANVIVSFKDARRDHKPEDELEDSGYGRYWGLALGSTFWTRQVSSHFCVL